MSFIIWNFDPELVNIFGRPIAWYGLLFALGFLISQQVLYAIFKKEGKNPEDVDTLTVYMVIATIIGARLGHVFFYEPARYLQNPIDILKIWEGGLASHGAAIAIFIALYIYSKKQIIINLNPFQSAKWGIHVSNIKREGQGYLQVLDRIAIVVALTGILIRLGNFMNSEIYGYPTGSDKGVFYGWNISETLLNNGDMIERIDYVKDQGRDPKPNGAQPIAINLYMKDSNYSEADYRLYLENTVNRILGGYTFISDHIDEPINHNLDYDLSKKTDGRYTAKIRTYAIPRYPTQLFESSSYLLVFIILFLIWRKEKENTPPGKIFGYFLVILWIFRFSWEFLKENQVAFEDNLPLNMGQFLSIPLIVVGFYLIYKAKSYKSEITSG